MAEYRKYVLLWESVAETRTSHHDFDRLIEDKANSITFCIQKNNHFLYVELHLVYVDNWRVISIIK